MKTKMKIKNKFIKFLRWSEKYLETDMVYATKGSFWIFFGQTGIFLIAFAKMIAFGRYTTPEVYGTYTFLLSMATMLSIFSLPGINTSLVKAISRKKEGTLDLAVKERFKFSLLGSLVSLAIAGWYFYNQNYLLGPAFLMIAVLLPPQNVFSIFSAFWQGRKNFEKSNKYDLFSAVIVALVVIPIIIKTNNPVIIIVALFGAQSFLNLILLKRTHQAKENNEEDKEAISFGKNLTAMSAIAMIAGQVDKVILWKFFGPVSLAVYSFAQVPIDKLKAAIPIGPLALPKMGEKNIGDIKEGVLKKFKKLFFLFVPLTITVILIAPVFYKMVLPQYIESIPYFQGFALLLLFTPFALLNTAFVTEMKKKELYIIQIASPLSKIIFFLILIPFFGIWGIVIAILLSSLLGGMLSLYFFRKL
jgi:O-antigen/teichoic acid export membrane protein